MNGRIRHYLLQNAPSKRSAQPRLRHHNPRRRVAPFPLSGRRPRMLHAGAARCRLAPDRRLLCCCPGSGWGATRRCSWMSRSRRFHLFGLTLAARTSGCCSSSSRGSGSRSSSSPRSSAASGAAGPARRRSSSTTSTGGSSAGSRGTPCSAPCAGRRARGRRERSSGARPSTRCTSAASAAIAHLFLAYFVSMPDALGDDALGARARIGAAFVFIAICDGRPLFQFRVVPRAALHRHLPLRAAAVGARGRPFAGHRLRRAPRRAAREARSRAGPAGAESPARATASPATAACRSARPGSTSATACSWSASAARPASTPATR